MSKIRILPEILSNKIAAGEVVERPASVVKELIENALDAGSTKIVVELEKGGTSLVRVSDNGTGMSHDEALLAIERYATSKISTDRDLFSIRTLGFRGEALPSIAAVSRFSVVSRDQASPNGVTIRIDGGKIRDVDEIGAPVGTMVTVRQLFFNTPARRKFLKTVATEMGHIVDVVSNMALGRPEVHFRMRHNEKNIKIWPPVTDPFARIIDVLGRDYLHELHPVQWDGAPVSLSGWISSPAISRSTSRGIHIFVNQRYVRDRHIQHALTAGYAQKLVKGQFPVAALFIRLPYDQVDVNVHPTKHEVRFTGGRHVYQAVTEAVARTLDKVTRPAWGTAPAAPRHPRPEISEPMGRYRPSEPQTDSPGLPPDVRQSVPRTDALQSRSAPHPDSKKQPLLWEPGRFSSFRVIGQLHNMYILCESEEGLVLIDQHAAHERILFEQIKNRASTARMAAQRLLIPETIDLGYEESEILEKLIPDLNRYGLEVEPFGGHTFVVKSVPFLLTDSDIKPLIIEMVEKIIDIGATTELQKRLEECLMIMACHGAIRASQSLRDEEIGTLLEQLDACENASHCPHGRPIWIRWTNRFLEKAFKRIV